jgi:phosphopantetheinyl transferase
VAPTATVATLQLPAAAAAHDLQLLTRAEQRRAALFHFERERAAFVTTRATLRRVLGQALRCEAAEVRLVDGEHGRPMLHDVHGSSLDFNVTHSGTMAAIALAPNGRVGIDIEWHRRNRGLRDLVPTVMGAGERALIESAASEEAFLDAFYACWTRKEAIVKGIGTGIVTDLTAIDVPEIPTSGVVSVPSTPFDRWRVMTRRVGHDFTLSIALAGDEGAIVFGTIDGHSALVTTAAVAVAGGVR